MKPTTMRHIHTLADSPSGLGLQRGLTLIEMMIAITISLILLAGVMQIFTGSRQTYRVQDNMARLQENGRFAMDFLNKDIRMADHWGCMKGTNLLTNNLTGSVNQGLTAGLAGTDGGVGTDTITLATAMSSGITVMDQMPTSSAIIQASPNTLAVNSIAIISNCINGDIFQITSTANTGTGAGARTNLGHNSGAGTPGNTFNFKSPTCPGSAANCLSADYGSGAEVLSMQTATYSIALDGTNNSIPTLYRSMNGVVPGEPLVEGVENMQILYGEDTDMTFPALPLNAPPQTPGDGSANRYLPANLVGDMRRVVSVRVGLVLITAENNLAITPQVYTGLDGLPATAPDRRLRRVFSSTIQLRNRV